MDLSVAEYQLPKYLSSNGYAEVQLRMKVTLGGAFTLTPKTDANDVYSVKMFLSTDDKLDSNDLWVSSFKPKYIYSM